MGEKKYYRTVREWLEYRGYYCGGGMEEHYTGKEYMYEDRGSSKMRVDVAGVKNVGSHYADALEVVCVEVKDSSSVKFSDITQAYGYTAVANRVYLAHTAVLNEYWERFLRRLGLGFLEIQGVRKGIIERVPPSLFTPDEANYLEFMRSLWIIKCSICGVYTFRWDTIGTIPGSSSIKVRRRAHIALHKGITTDPYDAKVPSIHEISRYVCRSCLEDFFFKKGQSRFKKIEQKWNSNDSD